VLEAAKFGPALDQSPTPPIAIECDRGADNYYRWALRIEHVSLQIPVCCLDRRYQAIARQVDSKTRLMHRVLTTIPAPAVLMIGTFSVELLALSI